MANITEYRKLHTRIREAYLDDTGEMCGLEYNLRKAGFIKTANFIKEQLEKGEDMLRVSLLISIQDEFNQSPQI
jgi:hypothetical protein